MEVINLIGDRLFLDYLITSNFNYTYVNNKIEIAYSSHLEMQDIDYKLNLLEKMLEDFNEENNPNKEDDKEYPRNLQTAIEILTKLKQEIANGYHLLGN
jgi:uncharacterized UPF0160 family protein